ncbi:MAG: DUF1080 domain-containing protein [Terracidiphilus sp.]
MLKYRIFAENEFATPELLTSIARKLVLFALLIVALPAFSQTINLFPEKYQDAWTRVAIPPDHPVSNVAQWHIDPSKRIIVCDGNGGHEWLRFNREFRDFTFHVKWRFTKLPGSPAYNSGVFFRNNMDGSIWHQAQTALNGGYIFGWTMIDGKLTHFNELKNMTENRLNPPGEWNAYDIRCVANTCALAVNGEVVNTIHNDVEKGYIGLEAEGYQIEFKNLVVKELP